MTLTPPSAGDPYRVSSALPAYAGPSSSVGGAPSPVGPGGQGGPGPVKARPSWVAWVALGLSALSFIIATSIGIVYAANSLSGSSAVPDGEGLYYDAGMPSWGTVDLTSTGQADERTLTDSVEEALKQGIEDFDGSAEDISDVYCEALAAPKQNSVASCSVLVQDVDSTVVLFFLDDDGGYLATLY